MKIDESLPETAFIPLKNEDGGHRGSSRYGEVAHFLTHRQNTTINTRYKASCGRIVNFGKSYADSGKLCKKCFPK